MFEQLNTIKNTERQDDATTVQLDFETAQQIDRILSAVRYGTLVLACIGGLIAGGLLTYGGLRVWRIEASRQALVELNATYYWQHETHDARSFKASKVRSFLAKWLGNSTVSGLSMVSLENGNPDDEQLRCVSSLHEVRRLDLVSNLASDTTLESIAKLPRLKYLTAVGQKFTISGLLKLRNAPELRQLAINVDQYSPIELAVLKAELPGVELQHRSTSPTDRELTPSQAPSYTMPQLPVASL